MKESSASAGGLGFQMNNSSKYGGSGFAMQNANLRYFVGLLYEFSKYNSDLKAILENSRSSVEQNQNQCCAANPYAINNQSMDDPFESNSSQSAVNTNNVEDKNDASKGNVKISGSKSITATSIFNLLTSQWAILVDTSNLPKYLQQIVNKLTNNDDLNDSNEIKTIHGSNVSNNPNKKLVYLNANQFQDLIYYFMINAVAKEKKMEVLTEQDQKNNSNDSPSNNAINSYLVQTNNAYSDAKQKMQTCFRSKNTADAYTAYWNYRRSVSENQKLKDFIQNEKSESNNFWHSFLWGVLKRASFLTSLYNLFTSGQNRRKYAIDTVLGSSHVLFLVSLIFGWGAIANTILGLITLAVLVYKTVNQYKQSRPRRWLYNLLITDTFYKMAKERDYALVPEVGNLFKYYSQNVDQITQQQQFELQQQQELYVNKHKQMKQQYSFAQYQQYPNSQYPNSQYPNSQYPNSQYPNSAMI